jgi:Xaa-Pro aminopeptidase
MSETTAARLEDVRIEAPGFEGELAQRHRLLREDLGELGAEVLIATREASVTYLTGYTTRTWSNFSRPIVALLFADGSLEMLCADTEAQQIEARVPNVVARGYGGLRPVEPGAPLPDGRFQFSPGAVEALDQLLRERGVSRIAVDGLGALHPPVSQLTAGLGEWPRQLIDASAALWERRLIKSDWEVEQLIRAARVLEAAFDLLPDRLAPVDTTPLEPGIAFCLEPMLFRDGTHYVIEEEYVVGGERLRPITEPAPQGLIPIS